jgi:hypothetical protein
VVGYNDAGGSPKVAATVGVWDNGRFIGVVVIWPCVNPEKEPRLGTLKEIVAALSAG